MELKTAKELVEDPLIWPDGSPNGDYIEIGDLKQEAIKWVKAARFMRLGYIEKGDKLNDDQLKLIYELKGKYGLGAEVAFMKFFNIIEEDLE
jgi:hypothetical protein